MKDSIEVGDAVRLLGVPEWLLHDLPKDEQIEIKSFIGRATVVEKIDDYGYFWIGFGGTFEEGGTTHYNGHSFCVPNDCLELLSARG